MSLMLKCKYCYKSFLCCYGTTRINGTVIDVKCPHCNKHTINNLGKFCEDQTDKIGTRLYRTKLMIELSHTICKLINRDHGN